MKMDPFILDFFAHVYVLTTPGHNVFYIGVSTDLKKRILDHQNGGSEFTSRYGVFKLVYFEGFQRIEDAIHREKLLKKWKRTWKIEMISEFNPEWKDLSHDVLQS